MFTTASTNLWSAIVLSGHDSHGEYHTIAELDDCFVVIEHDDDADGGFSVDVFNKADGEFLQLLERGTLDYCIAAFARIVHQQQQLSTFVPD